MSEEHPSKQENELYRSVYRRFLKGEIIERDLAYRTVRGQIFDELKMLFEIFIKNNETRD